MTGIKGGRRRIAGHGSLGAASISFTADELKQLNADVVAVNIQGERLPPAVTQMSAVEAPPKR